MILNIEKNNYMLPANCKITSKDSYVIIDEVESLSFTSKKKPSPQLCRLAILFDKARTARWFAELIKESVLSGHKALLIEKINHWDINYPFGYKYIIV